MIPTKTINLDFWRYPTKVLNLVQGESAGRTLRFNLVDGTDPFDLTNATAAWFAVKKSDETVSLDHAVIIDAENGIVEVTFSSQSVAAAGDAIGELQILTAESLTKSFNIPINIQQSVDTDGIPPSETELGVLQTLIGQAETVISIANTELWPEVVANAEYFSDLAGSGRTTETVKGNANEIADHIADDENPHTVTLAQLGAAADADLVDLAGDGRTTETVKGNANEIAAIKDRASQLTKIYGVQFTGSSSAGVRTHDAVGMVANVGVDDQIVVNDFDNVSFFQRPRCLVYHDEDGRAQVMAYEGEPDFSLTGAVFPPHTEKAQVFYEQKPFYWNGDLDWPQVTATPLEGFELAPMFRNPTDKVYLPSYWMGEDGGKACSLSGTHPTGVSINTGMTSARTYHPRAHLETMDARICEYVLQLVEFATRDVQTVMMGATFNRYNAGETSVLAETGVNRIVMSNAGASQYVVGQTICIGTTQNGADITPRVVITGIETLDESSKAIEFDGDPLDIPLGAFISSRPWKNGATDIVKASSGSPVSNSDARYPCIWRGKVDPWGNSTSAISDVLIQRAGTTGSYSYTPYRLPDPTLYNAGAIDSNWVEVGYKLATEDGYVTALGSDPKSPGVRMPTDVDGSPVPSQTNYFAAYYHRPTGPVSAVFVGGHWYSSSRCSPVFFDTRSAPSKSEIYRLGRLFVTPL